MIRKLIILGIDGMDRDVVLRYKEELPNLYSLLKKNNFPFLRSVFPADTTPAWSTIYTGVDPSEHGIINFVNVGAKDNTYKPLEFDDSEFKGKVFWDVFNKEGISCAVILPMNIKEGWEINGLMITRPYEGKINVYPHNKERVYQPRVDILGTDVKFTSEKDLPALRDEFLTKVNEEIRLTRQVMQNEEVDVLFSYFSTTDGIQHDFWRHCDPKHPEYPGPNVYENIIRDMYITMDQYIGEVMEMQPDTPLLIFSDHGHGARPVYTVRINELLRRGGYLMPKGGGEESKPSIKKKLKKIIKKTVLRVVKIIGLPKWAMKLAKKFPIWKNLFASGSDFDWEKTVAYLSDLSALKNYSYGGIRLSENVQNKDSLADEIIDYLKAIKIEGEDHGKYLNKYPEIIYQMDESWGGEWELGKNVFEKNGFMYMMSPGGHRWRTAVLLGNNVEFKKNNYEMTDIYKIIMAIVGAKG